jgi:hypothetical protein
VRGTSTNYIVKERKPTQEPKSGCTGFICHPTIRNLEFLILNSD